MPIDPDKLRAIAAKYAESMTSIRGRRIQRLVMREFSSFDYVVDVTAPSGANTLVALAADRAAFCATEGKGKEVAVTFCAWDPPTASETRFDLLKDSLPALGTRPRSMSGPPPEARLPTETTAPPKEVRALATKLLRAFEEAGA